MKGFENTMFYQQENLLKDLAYSQGQSVSVSKVISKGFETNAFSIIRAPYLEGTFENEVLNLDKVIRVGNLDNTPYLAHKSYPSPRSLYTSKILIKKNENSLIGIEPWSSFYMDFEHFSEQIENHETQQGDIILASYPITDTHYNEIQLTLRLLELGHLIFNVLCLADIFKLDIKIINDFEGAVILRKTQINIGTMADYSVGTSTNLTNLKKRFMFRNSGRYFGGNSYYHKAGDQYPIKLHNVGANISKYIHTYKFSNSLANHMFVCQTLDKKITYDELDREYSFISARCMNCFYVLCLDKKLFFDSHFAGQNLSLFIEQLGMKAQNIILNLSSPYVFARPLKQIRYFFWKRYIDNEWVPFYGVYSGGMSCGSSRDKETFAR
ncbi:MAG: hypothetical protein ABF460_08390 [Oenococcus sp.]|uniref:hypothetical protein n=1 Tax=Oenococcus sp. TaxID=1979414 RepID=UPI0039ED956C